MSRSARGLPRFLTPDTGFIGALVVALLLISFLPPDTSLSQAQESGSLRVCVPNSFPPLVTEDANAPGVELELLGSIAQDLGLRLQVTRHAAIGRSFNPRDWRITRAQCLLIAGGIPDTANTRSFLSVTAPHTETGWAAITLDPQLASLQGVSVGFLPGLTGLDRIALSAYLRNQGASLTILSSRPQAIEGLRSGSLQVVVSDSMVVGNLMAEVGGSGSWLPVAGSPSPVGFGMWKGDLTLERAIERSLQRLRQRGVLAEILDRYALEPLAECGYCR